MRSSPPTSPGLASVPHRSNGGKHRIVVLVGTAMEGMKLAPVICSLKRRDDAFESLVLSATREPHELDQVFPHFSIHPDMSLDLAFRESRVSAWSTHALSHFEAILRQLDPDLLLLQGHSSTVFTAALAAFNLNLAVGHVEAGCCGHELFNPVVEEANRRLMTVLTEIHWVPTPAACCQLLGEGVARDQIVVTGNILVDSLKILADAPFCQGGSQAGPIPFDGHRVLLLLPHHHEYMEPAERDTGLAVKELIERFPDLILVVVSRMGEGHWQALRGVLRGTPRVFFLEPLDLPGLVRLIGRAYLIMTESGGVEEESAAMGKPVLVLTPPAHHPAVVSNSMARSIHLAREAIVMEASRLLTSQDAYQAMLTSSGALGDGHAAERISESLYRRAHGLTPLLEPEQEFPAAKAPSLASPH